MSFLDRWELTENGDEAMHLWCVWEQDMFVGSVAVLSVACRDHPKQWQTFGWAPCTWVEQQLDDGGKRGALGEREPRQSRPVPEKGERGGEGCWKGREQLHWCPSECSSPKLLCISSYGFIRNLVAISKAFLFSYNWIWYKFLLTMSVWEKGCFWGPNIHRIISGLSVVFFSFAQLVSFFQFSFLWQETQQAQNQLYRNQGQMGGCYN